MTDLTSKSLPKLLVDGFDEEQVWQQIELQNKNAISHLENTSSKIDVKDLCLGIDTQEKVNNGDDSFLNAVKSDDEAMDDGEHDLDNEKSDNAALEESDQESEDLDDDDSDEYVDFERPAKKAKTHESASEEKSKPANTKKGYKTEVDDRFFKLSKLEQFLRLEDLKEERSWEENKNEDDLSDDDIDLFDEIPSDDGDSEEESQQVPGLKKVENFYDLCNVCLCKEKKIISCFL